ncbi:MAG: ArsR family transcriptional regulator [Candidatus Diapherotrites archaeon]|nr:ArsR family transcriptional regulator [Candidatus Diapherotrites archaeon]
MDWDEYVFIKSSKNRSGILSGLKANPLTVTELAKKLDNHRSTISQQLLKLEKRGFVKCLTPSRFNYRLYEVTPKGILVLKELSKRQTS